ncbi:MAG TPA: patatin-like phospholipase family protein [Rhodothermales bacterium]|nr:patatin [Bacteroidota bacterium]HRK73727.1 patatin-like phospholipase family protein [Rhodothermales bacterium]HRR08033.1 patatin-like phospholipase family protein [Rhodothermales bacterium]
MNIQPKIGLALGGGGMKGLAHLGALSVLEKQGIKPDLVAGCSIGALVGVFYAAGMPVEEIRQVFMTQDLLELMSIRLDGKGLIDVEGLGDFLRFTLPYGRFEDLPTPFFVMCTDIEKGEEVVVSSGQLAPAVLASTAVPGIFAPVQIGGRWLIDGGLFNNLPVRVLLDNGATQTIAVRLFNRNDWRVLGEEDADDDRDGEISWKEAIKHRLVRRTPLSLRVLERSLDLMIQQVEHLYLQLAPPDLLIEPDVHDISILGFTEDRDPIFERGVLAAERCFGG